MESRSRLAFVAVTGITVGLLVLPSCSGGSNPPAPGVSLSSVELISPAGAVAIGHPVTVEVGIDAEERVFDVPISFDILRRTDVDAGSTEVMQFHIASPTIVSLEAGLNRISLKMTIPADNDTDQLGGPVALIPDEYYLAGIIDPLNRRGELDDSDNHVMNRSAVINLVSSGLPDIRADHLGRDADEVVILHDGSATEGTSNLAHLEANLTIELFGTAPVSNVPIAAYVDLTGTANGSSPTLEPLLIWDSGLESYVSSYTIPELRHGEPLTVHLDLHIPPTTRTLVSQRMANHADFDYDLVIILDEDDLIAELEPVSASSTEGTASNNEICVPFLAIPPDPDPAVTADGAEYPATYDKRFADKEHYFGVDIELDSAAAFNGAGADFGFAKSTSLILFGKTIPFFGIGLGALHSPHRTADSLFSLEVNVADHLIWAPSGGLGFSYSQGPIPNWTWESEAEPHYVPLPGPFPPLLITGGALAGFELGLDVEIADEFSVALVPKLIGLQGYLQGGFGVPGAQAGVGGSVTLCAFSFSSAVSCDMSLDGVLQLLSGQLDYTLSYELDGPTGEVYAFAEWPAPKWCFLVPCGVKTRKAKLTLARWRLFVIEGTILQAVAPLIVVPTF